MGRLSGKAGKSDGKSRRSEAETAAGSAPADDMVEEHPLQTGAGNELSQGPEHSGGSAPQDATLTTPTATANATAGEQSERGSPDPDGGALLQPNRSAESATVVDRRAARRRQVATQPSQALARNGQRPAAESENMSEDEFIELQRVMDVNRRREPDRQRFSPRLDEGLSRFLGWCAGGLFFLLALRFLL